MILCFTLMGVYEISAAADLISKSSDSKSPDHTTDIVNKIIPNWMKKNKISGAAVEVYCNGVPHSYYFGYTNLTTKKPVTAKTIFEIGSISKVFTTLLIAEEINAGKMQLDAPIAQYLPDVKAANPLVGRFTLQNLGSHTTGFPLMLPDNIKTHQELLNYIANWKSVNPPNSQWVYSNVNIGLLGLALESVTHENINQLYKRLLLNPLGMTPLGVSVPTQLKSELAQGYDEEGNLMPHTGFWMLPAAAAVKATGNDMLLFLKASLSLPGTPLAIVSAMHLAQTPYVRTALIKQGLGWVIYSLDETNRNQLLNPSKNSNIGPIPVVHLDKDKQNFDENALIEKTGGTSGFRSYIVFIPHQKSGVVILINHHLSDGELLKAGREILFNLNSV